MATESSVLFKNVRKQLSFWKCIKTDHRGHIAVRHLITLFTIAFAFLSCSEQDIKEEQLKGPVTVIASTDVEEATIGDKIRYTITIISDPDVEVKIPQFGENLGGFAIKDFGQLPQRKYKGKNRQEQWYILDTYITGIYTIPAPVVKFTGSDGEEKEVEGNDVSVEVKSVIADGEEPEDIKDIAGPVDLPKDYTPYIWIGAVAVAIIGAGVTTYILLRRRERVVEEAPPRPAHEIAYEQLQEIADAELIETGETEAYYVLLSAIVRHYLENRFGLHAPEMTTEEFLQIAASDSQLVEGHKSLLRDFLTECDLVKFARYGPGEGQMRTAFESAKRFVDETRADTRLET
jgi:hypothetical protein